MDPLPPRLEREFITIRHMIELYCRRHHGTTAESGLCPDCLDLRNYARKRLQFCPYQEEKPACLKCPIHCYSPSRREEVRKVMRYSGPRMMLHHPVLALLHQLDGLKAVPDPPPGRRAAGKNKALPGDTA